MEWPIRKELLGRLWQALGPVDASPGGDEALAWRFFSHAQVRLAILLLFSLLFYLLRLGAKVLEGDEATYALLSKTIALSGDWTSFSLNGEPYLKKPPLYFWLTALVFDESGHFGEAYARISAKRRPVLGPR